MLTTLLESNVTRCDESDPMQVIASPLGFGRAPGLLGGTGDAADRNESTENFSIFRPRPPIQTHDPSESIAREVMLDPTLWATDSFWDPALSSRRHNTPVSVPITASFSETLAAQVKVLSPKAPSKQFLPESAFGIGLAKFAADSGLWRDLPGDPGLCSGSLHTLACRTPTVTNVCPIQHMSLTNAVHLFVECSLADPFFKLTAQIKRNPSLTLPSDAK